MLAVRQDRRQGGHDRGAGEVVGIYLQHLKHEENIHISSVVSDSLHSNVLTADPLALLR